MSTQTVLSNAVVSWLHSSLRGLENMRPLLTHTLDVVAIHIRYAVHHHPVSSIKRNVSFSFCFYR
jgi:hypothetical protein